MSKYRSQILQDAYNEGYKNGSESLRDKFAGQAMQGMISYELMDYISDHKGQLQKFCELSYFIADRMLEAKNE